mgnify:FL=1
MVTKKTPKVVLTAVAIVIAAYILSPFYLVLINTFKNANGIVANPVSFAGASFAQFKTNISNVVNNSNFSFWSAFGTSAIITVVSLVLLALFGGMAAWVICRNKTKWSTAIYMTFIASMTIPFQVVMLPLVSTFRDVGKFLGINMLQSIPGIVFAYCGFGGAMTVFILTGFIKGIPYELEEGMKATMSIIEAIRPGQSVGIFIGPEGGFEEAEVELAMQSGFMPVTLGKRILRTETAGLTVMAWLMYQLEDSGIS